VVPTTVFQGVEGVLQGKLSDHLVLAAANNPILCQVNNDVSWIDSADNTVHGLMPGFPVAFLVCKDIVIRVTHDASSSSDQKAVDSKSAASSGGFLCFSFSQSSSSSSSATSSNFQAYSNGYIIKIPGPQVRSASFVH
jgi:hypothetical protein